MGSHYSRLEVLGRRLSSIVNEERADAAKGLGREAPSAVIDLVQRILATSSHLPVKRDAVSAIAYTRSDLALDALLDLSVAGESEPEVRAQATEGLGYVIQFKSRGHPRFGEIADALVARQALERGSLEDAIAQRNGAELHGGEGVRNFGHAGRFLVPV